MKFFNRNTKQDNENRGLGIEESNLYIGSIFTGKGTSFKNSYAMKLSTVFRCVNLIGDSIASLELLPYSYKDNWKYCDNTSVLYNVLNIQPNPFISSFDFRKLLVINLLMTGNAFVLIIRNNKGEVIQLQMLATANMTVELNKQKTDIQYKYNDNGKVITYDKTQIAHIKNYFDGGLLGKSTIEFAADSLGLAYDSEQSARNWFQGLISGILSPKAGVNMTADKAKNAKENFLNTSMNGISVLDSGLEFQRINISPKDSQLLDSREFNIKVIAAFFGVPNSFLGLDAKYANSEQETLSFLNNTLNPLIEKIESELFRKIFLPSEWATSELKFNVENLMRLDAITKAEYYSKLFNVGGFTTNEIREKLDAKFPVKGGNRAFIQVNLQPVDNLISEQTQTTDPTNQINNQIK